MNKIVLFAQVSLDGYFEGPNRELDWSVIDEPFHAHMNEVLAGMGAFLAGRVTWQLMADHWPAAGARPGATPIEQAFSRIWVEMPKVVYTRTLTTAGWSTTIARDVVPEEVEAVRRRVRGDLVVGAGQVGAAFMAKDLVDEYRVYVHPIRIGAGNPLFPPSAAKVALRLLDTRTFGNGAVLLRYERARGGGANSQPSP